MPFDNEQKEGLVLSIWQAITLVGDVRERSDEIEPSELEFVLAEAESLLIDAVSEAAQRPGRPARKRRGLRFWKAAHNTPSRQVSWSASTSVIPFPGTMISKAAPCFRFDQSTAPRIGNNPRINRPAEFALLNPGGMEAETGRPSAPRRGVPISGTRRLLLLLALAVLPMVAIQAWHERDLRDERGGIIRERVVYRVQQLAAEIGELREGARQLLLAIGQSEAVKLRQEEACSTLLARLRSRYPNYSLLGAADAQGRIFCASGPTTTSVADQSFFTRAMDHDGLAVGNYWVNPTNGQKMINFAQQFNDSSGSLAGVIFAGLDLTWLSDHLKGDGLPPTSSKLIADREGNIIARLPHPEEYVGKNMRGSHERIMDGGEAGWEEVTGVDGVTRIFGYVPSSLPPKDFFLSIGEAKAESFAAINSATRRDAALILAALLGSVCVAWAGRNLVLGPAKGQRQHAADHQFTREIDARLADPFVSVGTQLAGEAIFVVRQTLTRPVNGRHIVSSTKRKRAVYSARGPPKH
jgi:Cache domain